MWWRDGASESLTCCFALAALEARPLLGAALLCEPVKGVTLCRDASKSLTCRLDPAALGARPLLGAALLCEPVKGVTLWRDGASKSLSLTRRSASAALEARPLTPSPAAANESLATALRAAMRRSLSSNIRGCAERKEESSRCDCSARDEASRAEEEAGSGATLVMPSMLKPAKIEAGWSSSPAPPASAP